MYSSSGYSKNTRAYSGARLTKAYTPQLQGYRPSPKLLEAIYSPKSPTNCEIDPSNIADFINLLQGQLKRISSTFSFNYSPDPPLVQALDYISQTIDILLEEKSKTSKDFGRLDLSGSDRNSLEWSAQKLKEEMDKSRETSRNLTRYEKLLKKKEEKLEEDRLKLKAEVKVFRESEDSFRRLEMNFEIQEKAWQDNKRYDQEKIRLDREEVDKKVIEVRDMKERIEKKIDETTKHLRFEKESLQQLEACLSETKQSLAQEQKKLSQEKLELEKEKWLMEQQERKLDENDILWHMQFERFEQEKEEIEQERVMLQSLRSQIEDEKLDFIAMIEKHKHDDVIREVPESCTPDEAANYYEGIRNESERNSRMDTDLKTRELEERENEIEEAYRELQGQMDSFNKELEERESVLDEREGALLRAEREFSVKMENFRRIEAGLGESKLQFEELRTITLPDLESQSDMLESLVKVLSIKKNEMEMTIIRLDKEIDYVQNHKKKLESAYGKLPENLENEEEPPELLEELTRDLEFKMQFLREREEDINRAEEQLELDREQVVRTAEFLKKAHLDVEEKRLQNEKEVLDEKEKIKEHFLKLETGMKLLCARELEVQSYKQKIDEKEKMLKMKEANLETKLQRLDSSTREVSEHFDHE